MCVRRFEDALKLETPVGFLFVPGEHFRRLRMGALECGMHLAFGRIGADHDEVPWLHEADGGRMVGSVDDAPQHFVRYRSGQKFATNVAA